jgi:hypothetical protein
VTRLPFQRRKFFFRFLAHDSGSPFSRCIFFILLHESGEGDRAFARWKGRRPRRFSATTTKLRLRRPLHHPSGGPPPPLPRGRMNDIVLAAHPRPSFAKPLQESPSKRLPTKREAERRQAQSSETAPAGAAAVSAETARLSALHRGSGQRLYPDWLNSRPCFLPGTRFPTGVTRRPPVPVQGLHLPHRP